MPYSLQQPLFKNRFHLTQANFGLCAPETMVFLMTSIRNERFATRPLKKASNAALCSSSCGLRLIENRLEKSL